MSNKKLVRSGTSATVLLLLLPFVVLSFLTYCGDDDGGGPSADAGPYDDGSSDTLDPDLAGGSGACCWGPAANEQCTEVEQSVWTPA